MPAIAALLLIPPLFFLGPSVIPAQAIAFADWTWLNYPYFRFARGVLLAEGRLPFWNPHIFSGMPFLASLNAHVLYPTEAVGLLLPIPASTFFALDAILHLWWAGFGAYVLLRRAGRSPAAAFTGALGFELGQNLFGLTSVGIPWIRDISWLPWLFVALESLRRRVEAKWILLAAVALGLPVLTAGVQYAAFAGTVSLAWLLLGGSAPFRQRAVACIECAAGSLGLSAVMWLPAMEYYRQSVRSTPDLYIIPIQNQWLLRKADLVSFLVPEYWGRIGSFYGRNSLPFGSDYFGLLTMALAIAGIVHHLNGSRRFLLLIAAGIVMAMGTQTPVGQLILSLPVFGEFRGGSRWLMFVQLGLAWFAASGFEALVGLRRRTWPYIAGLVAVAVGCFLLARNADAISERLRGLPFVQFHIESGDVQPARIAPTLRTALRKAGVAGAGGAAAIAFLGTAGIPVIAAGALVWEEIARDQVMTAAMRIQRWPEDERETRPEVATTLARIRGDLTPPLRVLSEEQLMTINERIPRGLQATFGYHGLPLTLGLYLHLLSINPQPKGQPAIIPALNVGWLVTRRTPAPLWSKAGSFINEDGWQVGVYRHPAPLPRVWFADRLVPVSGVTAALKLIRRSGWTPQIAIVDPPPIPDDPGEPRLEYMRFGPASSSTLIWGRDEMTHMVTATRPVLAVYSEVWYPAWKAMLDGRRVPILRADVGLRAVAIPPGHHVVRMIYDSWTFKCGLWLTFLSLGGLPFGLRRRSLPA